MYGEFQTPAPTTTNGNSGGGNRRSVRHSTTADNHFRDSELFIEDLDVEGSSIFGGGFQADGQQNRTRRQANNRNANANAKEKDNK